MYRGRRAGLPLQDRAGAGLAHTEVICYERLNAQLTAAGNSSSHMAKS